MMEPLQNVHICGSGHISAGHYQKVSIVGSGQVSGDVECTELHISGSAHVHGSVHADAVRISGTGGIDGNLIAAREVHISGTGHVGGLLKSKKASVSGTVRIDKGVECENMVISGACHVQGLLNAGSVEIHCNGNSKVEDIGAETVIVKKGHKNGLKILGISLFGGDSGTLSASSIEANVVKLEVTRADVVRGGLVEIGEGCEISRVEYTHSAIISPQSTVGELIQTEN